MRLVVCACLLASAALSAQGLRIGKVAIREGATDPLAITSPITWPTVTEGVTAPTVTIETSGGVAPVTCAVTSGSLPTGIIESSECVYSDDPNAAHSEGTTAITITATDDDSHTDAQAYSIVIGATDSGLPDGWESGDIGLVGITNGTVVYDDNGSAGETAEDIWTLTSSAPNIPTVTDTTTDSFRYACKPVTGDFTISVEVSAFTGSTFAQAGVMIRKDLTSSAPHMFAFSFPLSTGNTIQRKSRTAAAGATANENSGLSGHTWVRIARVGDDLTAFASTTGAADTWAQAGTTQTTDLDDTAYACLAVTNIVTTSTASVDFENLAVTTAPPIEPEDPDFGGYRSHYQGFGATTVGGRGDATKVYCIVTDRANTAGVPTLVSGAGLTGEAHSTTVAHYHGTFQQCVEGVDTSYLLFDVGGYVEMGQIHIANPYLTIAGQTAPDPVILRNGQITIDAKEIVFQHVQVRGGDVCGPSDAIMMRGATNPVFNVVFDHVAVGWCGHGSISISALPNPAGSGPNTVKATDILLVDSIIGESFSEGGPTGGSGSADSICYTITGNSAPDITGTMARNYWIHCGNRAPWIPSGMRADVYNNFAKDTTCVSGDDGTFGFVQVIGVPVFTDSLIEFFYQGNVNEVGPSGSLANCNGTIGVWVDAGQVTAGVRLHAWDNSGPGCGALLTDAGQASCFWFTASSNPAANAGNAGNSICNRACFTSNFSWVSAFGYVILPNASVRAAVLEEAGPFPMDRDPITLRLIGDATDNGGTTTGINNTAAVGGFPTITNTTGTSIIPATPASDGTCGTTSAGVVRPIIECDFETKARALEPRYQ